MSDIQLQVNVKETMDKVESLYMHNFVDKKYFDDVMQTLLKLLNEEHSVMEVNYAGTGENI